MRAAEGKARQAAGDHQFGPCGERRLVQRQHVETGVGGAFAAFDGVFARAPVARFDGGEHDALRPAMEARAGRPVAPLVIGVDQQVAVGDDDQALADGRCWQAVEGFAIVAVELPAGAGGAADERGVRLGVEARESDVDIDAVFSQALGPVVEHAPARVVDQLMRCLAGVGGDLDDEQIGGAQAGVAMAQAEHAEAARGGFDGAANVQRRSALQAAARGGRAGDMAFQPGLDVGGQRWHDAPGFFAQAGQIERHATSAAPRVAQPGRGQRQREAEHAQHAEAEQGARYPRAQFPVVAHGGVIAGKSMGCLFDHRCGGRRWRCRRCDTGFGRLRHRWLLGGDLA